MKIIWHRRDLRTSENLALHRAGDEAAPVYIFDPEWLESDLVCDARIEFVLESLKDLNRQYVKRDSHLVLLHGDPVNKLKELRDEGHEIFFNADSNHFNQETERKVREKFQWFNSSAVKTSGRGDAENWRREAHEWFDSKRISAPEKISGNPVESEISLEEIRDEYEVVPEKKYFGEGGTREARRRLENFLESIDSYSGSISSPWKAERSTSHLSPYIRYGCISPREVYQKARERKDEVEKTRNVDMFIERIFWQQHFNQKIEDNSELFREAINPVYRELNKDNYDLEKIEAWKKGETGFPLIDASMRALSRTGWLNFRMRAMCASFFSYILKQWWKIGADHFYKHLIDADVAINYYQWQMQSGLVGVHPNRIYDPSSQAEEKDPEGKFIKKYVAELRQVPSEYIAEPWKMPEKIQKESGVIIGRNYPEPVVNYDREARRARKYFKKKAPEAYSAFEDDKVWEKASLSSRHEREDIVARAGKIQADLEDF